MKFRRTATRLIPEPALQALRRARLRAYRARLGPALSVRLPEAAFRVGFEHYAEYIAVQRFTAAEPEFLDEFRVQAALAPVVYDVGGHIGLYSLAAAACNPAARVFAFEPSPVNHATLERNAALNGFDRVRAFNVGVGDKEGAARFILRAGAEVCSTNHVLREGDETGAVEVPIETLDRIVESGRAPAPDLVKIDVEGYEARVLHGMERVLERDRPVLMLEIHPAFMAQYGDSPEEMDRFLAERGYEKVLLRRPGVGKPSIHKQDHAVYYPKARRPLALAGPTVSVIVPTHERASLLPRALRSAQTQTHRNLDIIVVDDASRDETPRVCADIAAGDPRVRCVRSEENIRGAKARNLGLSLARGEYVAFLDDDDEWAPDKVALQLPLADAHSVVGCLLARERLPARRSAGTPETVALKLDDFFFYNPAFSPTTMLCRTDRARAVGGFDEDLPANQGINFFVKLAAAYGDAAYVGERLAVLYSDLSHGLPRVSTSRKRLEGSLIQFERDKAFRSPAARRYRLCHIDLMRMRDAAGAGEKLRWFLSALRGMDLSRPKPYARLFFGEFALAFRPLGGLLLLWRRLRNR